MKSRSSTFLFAGVCLAALNVYAAAYAQSGQGSNGAAGPVASAPGQIEEVVVTAEKRSELLSDVPMSVTALTANALQNARVTSPHQLQNMVPGLSYEESAYDTPVFSIRGIGYYDTSIGGSPAVSVYVDQVPLPFSVMTEGAIFDLQRVEILKGPQGTLFGQNSTGGAINFIAAKPTNYFSAGGNFTYGSFNETDIDGFVSGPLTSTLDARLAVRFEHRDPWQRSYGPQDAAAGVPSIVATQGNRQTGERRFYEARLTLAWHPTDRLDATFTLDGWLDRSEATAQQFVKFVPSIYTSFDPSTGYYTGAPAVTFNYFNGLPTTPKDARWAGWDLGVNRPQDNKFIQPALRVTYQLDDNTELTSITSYDYYSRYNVTDTDGTAFTNLNIYQMGTINTFTQELRLAGQSGPVRWMVGGNYEHDSTAEVQNTDPYNATNTNQLWHWITEREKQDISTYAAFGSLEYAITDELKAQGSVRYTKQDRSYAGCIADTAVPGDPGLANGFNFLLGLTPPAGPGDCVTTSNNNLVLFGPNPRLPIATNSLNQDNVSWKVGLKWKPLSDTLLYANVAKGYKAGTFTETPAVTIRQTDPVTQEAVLAYEAGFKTSLADRHVSVDGAVFRYDYKDKQLLGNVVVPIFGNLPALVNIPKSRITGAELNLVVLPVTGLRVSFGATYLDSKVTKSLVEGSLTPPLDPYGRDVGSYVGDPLPQTSKWQFVADAQYDFDISANYTAFIGGNLSYRSKQQFGFGNNPDYWVPSYTLVDLRAGFGPQDGTWQFELWSKNVTNTFYETGIYKQIDALTRTVGMPVTYGMSLRLHT